MSDGVKVLAPGWYDYPGQPGIQRYWTGGEQGAWDQTIPPRSRPEPQRSPSAYVWVIALGILAACAVVFFLYNLSQPSAAECLNQATDVALGERAVVDSACR